MTDAEWIAEQLKNAPPLTAEKRQQIVRLLTQQPVVKSTEVAS
ncbi:hypothetical protein [[Mycobacterium] appelbergii]|nr:hypothetical protein [Mycobacterium sp. 21AC1]